MKCLTEENSYTHIRSILPIINTCAIRSPLYCSESSLVCPFQSTYTIKKSIEWRKITIIISIAHLGIPTKC